MQKIIQIKNFKKIYVDYIMEIIIIMALIFETMIIIEIFKMAWNIIVDLRKK